ncbi:MAG: NAD(P)/FAD-dependent oxidoreductase [Parvibaculum sp.]|nr:NAD(P)/FAD-dependent oxidoreductase [Parvibaculum sp.]
MTGQTSTTDLEFDPAALRAKYRAERDKRVRADGNAQYLEVKDALAHYLDDPYIEAPIERAALADDIDVVVIGGGFGGMLAAARLREAGVENVRIIEKGGDFGGTWYWNRYPGAACDIESYIYLPLLEETGYMPVEKYTRAPEILAYCGTIARKYDLYRDVCFQTEVTAMHWEDSSSRWIIETNRGDRMRARFVSMANGPLHRPKLPGIPGVETFKGHSFHTSRWDYAYSGGSPAGGLTGLAGKRIGIIGTGATAVQCVPHIGETAGELFVFQRTPSSIDVRNNKPTDPEWAASLKPGWQQHRMDNFNVLVSGGFEKEDLVADGWTDIIRNLLVLAHARAAEKAAETKQDPSELVQLADFQKMEQIRKRVETVVEDKATAEALKPYYNQFCKRPCFHDEYLATFNRPNVHLIDTQGRGVERITEKGVVVDGVEYELDCLIYATGFEVGTSYTQRAGYEVYGRDGLSLTQKWAEGARTLHGMHVNGFPNCFIMSTSQAGFTANYPHALNEQSKHVAHIISHALSNEFQHVEATPEAEMNWLNTILSVGVDRQKYLNECTPGYYNNEGQVSPLAASFAPYGAGSMPFFKVLDDWRAAGSFDGLDLRKANSPA